MEHLPTQYKQSVSQQQTAVYNGEFISCAFTPYNSSLPRFQQKDSSGSVTLKSYKVPVSFDVKKVLNYLYENLGVKSSIIDTDRDN